LKVREQQNLIMTVEDKCKIIKEKIENLKNKSKDEEVNIPTAAEILEIEEKILNTDNTIKLEDKHYKQDISIQKEKIEDLNKKIIELTGKIKNKGRDILLNQKKKKENKKRELSLNKSEDSNKNNKMESKILNTSVSNKKLAPINSISVINYEDVKNRSYSAKQKLQQKQITLPKINRKTNRPTPLAVNKSKNVEY
jgi:hypothetical protein